MKNYQLYIFDLDGVLYRGDEPIPGVADAVARLRDAGKTIRYLTNNSSLTRDEYASKLFFLGFSAADTDVYSSASGAATFLESQSVSSAFIVGEKGLISELLDVGISHSQDDAEWVVVGICRALSYELLDNAQWHIRNGARFLATNTDLTFPDSGRRLRPGAGSIVAAVAAASGKQPDKIIGKPETALIEMILSDAKCAVADAVLIGDRPDTDLACANRAGMDSVLVLTGVTGTPDPADPHKATHVLGSVSDLA